MQQVLPTNIDCIVAVFQNKDYPRLGLCIGRHYGTHAPRCMLYVGIVFHIRQ